MSNLFKSPSPPTIVPGDNRSWAEFSRFAHLNFRIWNECRESSKRAGLTEIEDLRYLSAVLMTAIAAIESEPHQ